MTASLFILDVPENRPVVEVAGRDESVTVGRVGPYFRLSSDQPIVIDRRATGARHAVWYSCVAGLSGLRLTRWDKDQIRGEAR
jgi:hypothetical protein